MFLEMVASPYQGVVHKICAEKKAKLQESEALFIIRNEQGELFPINMDVTSVIHSLEVNEGDTVIPGMVLAYVQEELFVNDGKDAVKERRWR